MRAAPGETWRDRGPGVWHDSPAARRGRGIAVRYYVDEDVAVQVAPALRALGLDVLTTRDAERLRTADEDQLAFAATARRVIVTRNVRDFVPPTRLFESLGRPHAGVLLVTAAFAQRDYGGLARAIARYDREHPEEMAAYQADYLKRA